MLLRSNPQSRALIKYLASPNAADIWANLGGFASANKKVPLEFVPGPRCAGRRQGLDLRQGLRVQPRRLAGWLGAGSCGRTCSTSCKTLSASNVTTVEALMDTQATTALGH
jgi:hypothetical protein